MCWRDKRGKWIPLRKVEVITSSVAEICFIRVARDVVAVATTTGWTPWEVGRAGN